IEITRAMVDDPVNPRPDLEPYVGRTLTVIAWLWARTVKSPNPAFADVAVPLASTFMLSTKPGKEAWVEPVIENGGYRFTVRTVGGPPSGRISHDPPPAVGGSGRRPALGPKDPDTDRAEGGAPTEKERIAAAKNGTKLARGANFQCVMSGTPIAGDYIKAWVRG
ncbi:MAG: hypothetical protein MUF80_11800, partial [Burkholderiales bacterium]|nr:hypothetical protein [Burkholderiales bacterium]